MLSTGAFSSEGVQLKRRAESHFGGNWEFTTRVPRNRPRVGNKVELYGRYLGETQATITPLGETETEAALAV